MKKYTAIAVMLAAALTLSACGRNDNVQPENGGGTPSQTATENAPEESEENSGENNEQPSEAEIPEDVQKVIDMFDTDSFTAPDGSEVMLTEASSQVNDYALCFDFAYIRYAEPIYTDTFPNPELYDFENYEFTEENFAEINATPFKVEKGQVLDNGLTVAEASYFYSPWGYVANEVDLEGEITIEGLLFCFFEEEYGYDQDDLIFYTDPTSGIVPAIYGPFLYTMSGVDLYSEFAFIFDGDIVRLGSINEVGDAEWFRDRQYIKVRATLENLKLRNNDSFGTRSYATLKNVEFLDN